MRILIALLLLSSSLIAQQAAWTAPQEPVRIFGNSYWVGSRGLGAILITSPQGHILIDAPMAENVDRIAANIRALGFKVEDVRRILNTHPHFDHGGGTAQLQRLTAAEVAAREPTAKVMLAGRCGDDDPQAALGNCNMRPLAKVRTIRDGEVVRVGTLAVTAHATGGHTPGGTSFSWRACDGPRCADIVYADSLTPVSADGFRFTDSKAYPTVVADFERGFETLSKLSCDILVTPHPEASAFWERIVRRDRGGDVNGLVDREACRKYVAAARERLRTRLASEQSEGASR